MSATGSKGTVLVIGGGVAGLAASLSLVDQGVQVRLVERELLLGGRIAKSSAVFPTMDKGQDIIDVFVGELEASQDFEAMLNAEVVMVVFPAPEGTASPPRSHRAARRGPCGPPSGPAIRWFRDTQTLTLSGGSQITTSSLFSPGDAGTITINAGKEVILSQGILTSRSEGNIPDEFVTDYAIGNAGSVIVSAPTVTLMNHSKISSTTDSRYSGDPSKGNAGSVTIRTANLNLSEGSQLTSSSIIGDSGQFPVGNAGSVTIEGQAGAGTKANTVTIDGTNSGILTETQGTGAGGNITLNANSVTLQNNGTLSAKTSGTATSATGGTITVNADQVRLNNGGASVTTPAPAMAAERVRTTSSRRRRCVAPTTATARSKICATAPARARATYSSPMKRCTRTASDYTVSDE